MKTLSEILTDVNSYVDLEAALPTGDELATRTNFANQAVWDAATSYQFNEFSRIYEVTPSTNATIPLPSGFREFEGNPKQYVGGVWREYQEILPKERFTKASGDYYCYVLGNPQEGYFAIFNALDTSGSTLAIDFQAYPSGFATLTSICELDDPTFVTAKVESYVLQSRGDDRFPYVDSIADGKLRNMVARNMKSPGGQVRTAPAGFKNPLASRGH